MKNSLIGFILLITFQSKAQVALNLFDKSKMEYNGTKTQQAELLLRKVLINGHIETKKAEIDPVFFNLINKNISVSKEAMKNYLNKNKIAEKETGGNIDTDVSYIILNGEKIYAKYFVIHDVSNPVFENKFPDNINESSFFYNKINAWNGLDCHSLVTRTGKIKMFHDFSEGWRATKFEGNADNYEYGLGKYSKGLFLHIELVQPRVFPPGNKSSAAKAPTPGFTVKQYDKLALLYICASIRKGEWLIPAFHGCIDENMKVFDKELLKKNIKKWIEDNHDDPQNFELIKFTDTVLKLVFEININ